jgi:serine/threonine protein kinase
LALHLLTRKVVAVKSINKVKTQNEDIQKKVINELNIMSNLRHRNVVKFFEKLETEKHYLFFMEVCQGGDLL